MDSTTKLRDVCVRMRVKGPDREGSSSQMRHTPGSPRPRRAWALRAAWPPSHAHDHQRRASAAVAGREVGALGDVLRHELCRAGLGGHQQLVLAYERCLDLLLLDLIFAPFSVVESRHRFSHRRRRLPPAASAPPQHVRTWRLRASWCSRAGE